MRVIIFIQILLDDEFLTIDLRPEYLSHSTLLANKYISLFNCRDVLPFFERTANFGAQNQKDPKTKRITTTNDKYVEAAFLPCFDLADRDISPARRLTLFPRASGFHFCKPKETRQGFRGVARYHFKFSLQPSQSPKQAPCQRVTKSLRVTPVWFGMSCVVRLSRPFT